MYLIYHSSYDWLIGRLAKLGGANSEILRLWFGAVASGSVAAKTATSQRSRLRTSSLEAAWMSWQRTAHPHVEDPTKVGNFWANRNCTDTKCFF